MKSNSLLLLTLCCVLGTFTPHPARAQEQPTRITITTDASLLLSTREQARAALSTEDDFIRALSEFDRASRAKAETVSRSEFLKFIADQALAWTDDDRTRIERAGAAAKQKLTPFKLSLPREILLVKTTGREEANTAYCRSTNIIVLSTRFVNAPPSELETVLVHELFHIFSRNNPRQREQLYALIGFKPCGEVPHPAELQPRRITNPDAPHVDYLIEVKQQQNPVTAVPVLFATPERWTRERGGEFFDYFTWKLMAVERTPTGWRAVSREGRPVLLGMQDVTGFREQVGPQPGRVLQPEEISAEYFVRLVMNRGGVPAPVLDGMKKLLSQ